jgi:hypothetical protein
MIGGKDSDMQADSNAGVTIRRHDLTYNDGTLESNAKTHKIYLLRETPSLLTASVVT